MSNKHLITWFDHLLFGNKDPQSPPQELRNLILRLESENVSWNHIILNGGLTLFPYQIHGDLNSLIDYLEKIWIDKLLHHKPPIFKTKTVSKFWDQLQILLARYFESAPPPLTTFPSERDDEILKQILDHHQPQQQKFNYQSADFWGEVARKFIHLSSRKENSSHYNISSDLYERAIQLYEITCEARGYYFDPLTMHLVPNSDYLNAAHWQTARNLETFIHDQPSHPLSVSVQILLKRCLIDLLHGKKSSILPKDFPHLDAFLHNVTNIHDKVEQVPHDNEPPKLIDVFQRLLALSHLDNLWEKNVPEVEFEPVSLNLLYLTEKIRILEHEKRILMKHIISNNS